MIFLDLIYPNVCGICGRINKESLCPKCAIMLRKYTNNNIIDYRNDKSKYFDYYINIFKYEGIIREKIISYKFNENAYLYKTFSKIILNNKKICGILKKYDIIISVPMFKYKKLARGYNQTELIAYEISKNLGINMYKNILIKTKNNNVQSTLKKAERQKNVKNAFEISGVSEIQDKKIILLDDIYTTGSTVNECSRILKKANAKEILVLTIAKD